MSLVGSSVCRVYDQQLLLLVMELKLHLPSAESRARYSTKMKGPKGSVLCYPKSKFLRFFVLKTVLRQQLWAPGSAPLQSAGGDSFSINGCYYSRPWSGVLRVCRYRYVFPYGNSKPTEASLTKFGTYMITLRQPDVAKRFPFKGSTVKDTARKCPHLRR